MRQQSTRTHRREPWTRNATERAEHHRSRRQARARIRQDRDRLRHAHQETQACVRHHEAQAHGLVVASTVDLGWRALRRFRAVRLSVRAVSRVLQLRAAGCGSAQAPCPHTVRNGLTRLAIVRGAATRSRRGLPRRAAPCSHGLLWRMESRMGLGPGKM